MGRLTRKGRPNPSRETIFSGANGDREISIFPVQLTTKRIACLTRLISAVSDNHAYIHTVHAIHQCPYELCRQ